MMVCKYNWMPAFRGHGEDGMKVLNLLFIAFLAVLLSAPAFAGKEYGKENIDAFCAEQVNGKPRSGPPAPGVRFDGKPAEKAVMDLAPGQYSGKDSSAIYLYDNGHFLLYMPEGATETSGTGGDDFMAPRTLGGCSREQLSEALAVNGLDVAAFSPEEAIPLQE